MEFVSGIDVFMHGQIHFKLAHAASSRETIQPPDLVDMYKAIIQSPERIVSRNDR